MKIDPTHIVQLHIDSLRDPESRKILLGDLFVFFVAPVILGLFTTYWFCFCRDEIFSTSISVFAVFSALLLNAQVAIFGMYRREWKKHSDQLLADRQADFRDLRRRLMSDVNSNISYLILVSCSSLFLFTVFYVFKIPSTVETFASSVIFMHFFLTLLMVIKRVHALFYKEYEEE